jgi:hypothetical protein
MFKHLPMHFVTCEREVKKKKDEKKEREKKEKSPQLATLFVVPQTTIILLISKW